MTASRQYTLRIDMSLDFIYYNGRQGYALYSNFVVGPAALKYQLMSVGQCNTSGCEYPARASPSSTVNLLVI